LPRDLRAGTHKLLEQPVVAELRRLAAAGPAAAAG
jgi:hypothetical protein